MFHTQIPELVGTVRHAEPHRKRQAQSGGRGRGEMWARAFVVVAMGKNGRGRMARLRAGQFEYFEQAPGYRGIPNCLVLGLGMIKAGG